jgi:ABC-type uncharacterized transport system involved in gliding motility auxiliary subunit
MSSRERKQFAYGSLAVIFIGFIAAVIAGNSLLRGVKLDLTENRLYTLADGTKSLLRNLGEPINLYYFFSNRGTEDVQVLRSYATRVEEMLVEFNDVAGDNLRLQIIDPLPFSEDEDRAAQFGLRDLGLTALGGDSIYFGLAATNAIGDEAIIEVFDPEKEAVLEYDLARLIYSLSTPEKSVVGLLSGVPMSGGFDPQTQQMQQPWVIGQQLRQLFEIRNLTPDLATIDSDVKLLWIVHPVDLSENTLYAIDQFLLKGGRALIFVDPLAEIATIAPDPTGLGAGTASNLERLFDAWGLEFDPSQVVGDDRYALSVSSSSGRPLRHIGLLGLDDEAMADDEIISADLGSVNLGTAGELRLAEGAAITLTPLLESSTESALLPGLQFQFLSDPRTLLDGFVPGGVKHVLAARIEGPLVTAFPDGPPSQANSLLAPPDGHVTSAETSSIVVVADVDILSDRLWVQRQRSIFGSEVASAFANNGDFVANAIAYLAGSEDLLGIKSRQTYIRPFDRVENLQRDAEARFRETEQRLQAELAATEQTLGELQAEREDTGSLLMNAEQQQEIQRFRDEQLRIRQELRTVQRELDSSIESLGRWLKIVNIVLFPALLAALALALHLLRRPRKAPAK